MFETDFPNDADGKAIPYGIYDLARNEGYVVFAIAAIRSWWLEVGRHHYAGKKELLIQADGGGANGSRCWLWKWGLQQLANEFNLTITVDLLHKYAKIDGCDMQPSRIFQMPRSSVRRAFSVKRLTRCCTFSKLHNPLWADRRRCLQRINS